MKDFDESEDIPILLTDELRENLLTTALEGGSNYWYFINDEQAKAIRKYKQKSLERDPEYGDCFSSMMYTAMLNGEKIYIQDIEDEDNNLGIFSKESILKGERILADKHKQILGNILKEQDDVEDADIWFQLCVMGRIEFA